MDVDYMRALCERNGNHWFDRETMRFFNSIVHGATITKVDEDTYRFITSERFDDSAPRRYTVREFRRGEGVAVETVGVFQQYATRAEAVRNIRTAGEDEE